MPVRFTARPGIPVGVVLVTLGVLGAFAIAFLGLAQLPFMLCLFKAMTGMPCVTCGGTRAMARLVAFDLRGAFLMNPLVTFGLLCTIPWAAADLALWRRKLALSFEVAPEARSWMPWAVIAIALTNWGFLVWAGR
jgi:hypothetical protein